jgi:hypothetical protein
VTKPRASNASLLTRCPGWLRPATAH